MKLWKEIGDFFTELIRQFVEIFVYIFNPKNITVVGVIIAAIGIGAYIMHISMKFDYMLTVNNGYRCNISENSILVIIFAVFFFGIFALFAIGEAVSILEYKKKFQKKLPDSMKRSILFNAAFAICALIIVIIVMSKCW